MNEEVQNEKTEKKNVLGLGTSTGASCGVLAELLSRGDPNKARL